MTKIYGSMVMKNEADRYLRAVLEHMRPFLDQLFIFDDNSTDDSRMIATQYDTVICPRPADCPSWIEHEGKFRQSAWGTFEVVMQPHPGDWILSFDADEFLVRIEDDFSDVRPTLDRVVENAKNVGDVGVVLPFPEIFDIANGIPMVRTDGLWDTIRGPRLFEYRTGGSWSDRSMGCGSEPTYVAEGPTSSHNLGLNMLHFGYAKPEEHAARHERYSELLEHGHSNKHVQSIIQKATLQEWDGPIPRWSLNESTS